MQTKGIVDAGNGGMTEITQASTISTVWNTGTVAGGGIAQFTTSWALPDGTTTWGVNVAEGRGYPCQAAGGVCKWQWCPSDEKRRETCRLSARAA